MTKWCPLILLLAGSTACISTKSEVDVKPIEVKPIHVTVDINIKVQVDKELDDLFGDIDSAQEELEKGE